jgi:hypothetical protein
VPDDLQLEPQFVVCRCDHCRNGIEFDVVQLAGRHSCRVPCPHCSKETTLREPPPPPRLVPDEGWTQPMPGSAAPKEISKEPEPIKEVPKVVVLPSAPKPPAAIPLPDPIPPKPEAKTPRPHTVSQPPAIKPIVVNLPPNPPPPPRPPGKVDVRWLTDLGVVYFRQHQFSEAYLCFTHAAQQGFATAQFCLAVCYFNGHGTAQNEAAAIPWLQNAAALGDGNAEFTLGLAYRMGRGLPPDETLALQWLHRAARHGHPEAIKLIGDPKLAADVQSPPPAARSPVEPVSGEAQARPRQDLQRLILGLFRKK